MQSIQSRITATAITAVLAAGVGVAQAQQFEAFLSGDQEVPPVDTPATGIVLGVYDSDANTFSFNWDITDNLIGEPSAPGAHIHMAPAGSNGGIVFFMADGEWPLEGEAVWSGLSGEEVDALFNEGLYLNFHTTEFPGGEVRGQITLVPAPAAGMLLLGAAPLALRRRR